MQRDELAFGEGGKKVEVFSVEVTQKEERRVVKWRGGKVRSELSPACCSCC